MAARKKTKRKFRAVKAVKAAAREKIGAPPATRREPERPAAREDKHKPTLGKLLQEE
jgi:hypothetical protein